MLVDAVFEHLHGQVVRGQIAQSVSIVAEMCESGVWFGQFGALDVAEGDVDEVE